MAASRRGLGVRGLPVIWRRKVPGDRAFGDSRLGDDGGQAWRGAARVARWRPHRRDSDQSLEQVVGTSTGHLRRIDLCDDDWRLYSGSGACAAPDSASFLGALRVAGSSACRARTARRRGGLGHAAWRRLPHEGGRGRAGMVVSGCLPVRGRPPWRASSGQHWEGWMVTPREGPRGGGSGGRPT